MTREREDSERELKDAVRALEDALDAVRRARRRQGGLDIQAVHAALRLAERQLQAAQTRVREALARHDATVTPDESEDGA